MSEPTFDDLWNPTDSTLPILCPRKSYCSGRDDLAKLVLAKLGAIIKFSRDNKVDAIGPLELLRNELIRRVRK